MPAKRPRRYSRGGTFSEAEYQALAEFRHRLACFLSRRQQLARAAGLEPQQYELLLAIAGLPKQTPPTIKELAAHLRLEHHSVVELADRLQRKKLLARRPLDSDKRVTLLQVTAAGQRAIQVVVRQSLAQLRTEAPPLLLSLRRILRTNS
jgi:DNA-binding MarR family transcriptional regulator